MLTEIDLNWVTFSQEEDSVQCEGFETWEDCCTREAVWKIVYDGCPLDAVGYICELCRLAMLEYTDELACSCPDEHDICILVIERIKK